MANVLNSNELRPGTVFLDGTEVLRVLSYQHRKYGRGQATIRVKVKNIHNGSISEKTYDSNVKLEEADTKKKSAQFLYSGGDSCYFMDTEDYSQFQLPAEDLETELKLMKEGEKVITLYLDEAPVSIELPKAVELEVVKAAAAVAGDTSGNATKKVEMETGLEVDVPLFIKQGEVLKINTESATYIQRVN